MYGLSITQDLQNFYLLAPYQALDEDNALNSRWRARSTLQQENQGDVGPVTLGHVRGHFWLIQLGGCCWHPVAAGQGHRWVSCTAQMAP